MAINTIVFHLHFLSGVLCNSISVSPCIPLPDWKKKRGRKEKKEEEERLLMGEKKKNKNSKKQGGRRSGLHVAASSSSEVKIEVNKRGRSLTGNRGRLSWAIKDSRQDGRGKHLTSGCRLRAPSLPAGATT